MTTTFLYLLTTYKLQDQALRLIEVLQGGGTNPVIVVRHDAKTEPLDPRIADHPGVHVVPGRAPVNWGDATYLDAVLDAFEWSLRQFEFDWLTLLSGQDYPLMPIRRIEHLQTTSGFDGFIQARPLSLALPAPQAKTRTEYRWSAVRTPWPGGARTHAAAVRALGTLTQRAGLQRLLQVRAGPGTDTVLVGRRHRMPDLEGLQLYGACDWFSVSRHLVEAAVDFRHREPTIGEYLRRTLNPSELYFPTVFMATRDAHICNTPLRFKWFPDGSPHPAVLTLRQLDRMLSSGCHFARKFDARVDATVLDELDRVIANSEDDALD